MIVLILTIAIVVGVTVFWWLGYTAGFNDGKKEEKRLTKPNPMSDIDQALYMIRAEHQYLDEQERLLEAYGAYRQAPVVLKTPENQAVVDLAQKVDHIEKAYANEMGYLQNQIKQIAVAPKLTATWQPEYADVTVDEHLPVSKQKTGSSAATKAIMTLHSDEETVSYINNWGRIPENAEDLYFTDDLITWKIKDQRYAMYRTDLVTDYPSSSTWTHW